MPEVHAGSLDPTFDGDVSEGDVSEEAGAVEDFFQECDSRETLLATRMALEASLQGVTYSVRFFRPDDAGGVAAGRSVDLRLDALSLLGNVKLIVEMELFGSAGQEPAHLTFNGQCLPPDVPLHCLGIDDGDTIIVASVDPQLLSEEDFSDDPVLRWAAGY
jgi:hypothetical protein